MPGFIASCISAADTRFFPFFSFTLQPRALCARCSLFGYLHVPLREACLQKSALCMDDWVRWQRLSEVIICRVDGERQCKMVRLSPFCCFSTIFLSPSYPCLAVPFGPGSQLMFTCRLLQLLTRSRYFSSHFTPNFTERSSRIPFLRSTTAGHFATLL